MTTLRSADDPARRDEAWVELLARHRAGVEAVCHRRLGGDPAVDDAVQEAFVRALSRLDDLRDPSRFGPWVRAIAASVCVDVHRERRHARPEAAPAAGLACDGPTPADVALASDEARRLHEHLSRLGERDRVALWLRDGHGASVGEVAARLGVTEGSARVLLHRARTRLRQSLDVRGLAAPVAALVARLRVRQAGGEHVVGLAAGSAAALVVGVSVLLPGGAGGGAPDPAAPVPVATAPAPDAPASVDEAVPSDPTSAASVPGAPVPGPGASSGAPSPVASPGEAPVVEPRGPVVTRTPPAQEPVAEVRAGDGGLDALEGLVFLGDGVEAAGDDAGPDEGADGETDDQERPRPVLGGDGLPVGVERRGDG
ncbi:MAG: RNA polymerase sigma factor [Actinomycetes bacterium]